MWVGSNADYEGLQKVLSMLDPTWRDRSKGPSQAEVKDEWNRLKGFMMGRK